MVKKPTCFKNPAKPIYIDLRITNRPGMFRNGKVFKIGLTYFNKLVSIMKLSYKKRPPRMIKYRGYKKFSNEHFKNCLNKKLAINTELDYNKFEEIVLNLLSSQVPFKKRMIRADQRVFMNKEIHKAETVRSRLRNKFLEEKTTFTREVYNKNKETTAWIHSETRA